MKDINSRQIINNADIVDQAFIDLQQSDAPKLFQTMVIKMDTAAQDQSAIKIPFAFVGVYCSAATTSSIAVNLITDPNDELNYLPISRLDSFNFDRPVKNAKLIFDAVPGNEITLHFFFNAKMRPGKINAQVLSALDGSAFAFPTTTPVTINTTPLLVAPENLNRGTLNMSCNVPFVISTLAGGTLYFPVGTSCTLRNTAGIYAWVLSGTGSLFLMEEV